MNTQHTTRTILLWGGAMLCLALLLLTGPGRAAAQPPGPGADSAACGQFQDLDKDGDGGLTPVEAAEAPAVRRMEFDRLDTNRDGKLTPDEFAGPPRPGRDYARRGAADGPRGPQGPGPRGHEMQRGPGGLHEDGPPQGPRPPRFEEPGTDREFAPPPRGPRGEYERPGPPAGRGGYGRESAMEHQDGHSPGQGMRPPRFEELDMDGDGKLSRAEAETIPPVRHLGFDALDKDGDGLLSREELPPPPHRGPGGPGMRGPGPRGPHGAQ